MSKKLKKELESFREYERETYEDVISKLVRGAKEDEEEKLELSEETLKCIQEGRDDYIKGRVFSSRQIRKELGL